MKKALTITTCMMLCLFLLTACTPKNQALENNTSREQATNAALENGTDQSWHLAKFFAEGETYWSFVNHVGQRISETKWQRADPFSAEGLARVTQKDLMGLINLQGSVVVEPRYNWIEDFNEGYAVCITDNQKADVIDTSGKVIFSQVGLGQTFYNGLIGFQSPEGFFGYLDTQGQVVIEPIYAESEAFKYGSALVKTTDLNYVLLDLKGNVLKTFNYERMWSVGDGLFAYGVTQPSGALTYGYMTSEDQVILEATYDEVGDFDEGLAVVGRWGDGEPSKGIVTLKGDFKVPMTYGALGALGQGYFAGKKESVYNFFQALSYEKSALIDADGNALTEEVYYNLTLFDEGLFSASDGIDTFLIDSEGSKSPSGLSVKGIGILYKEGDMIRAEVDNQLAYYGIDGGLIWAEENKQTYPEVTLTKAFKRYGRFVLIEYPILSEVKNSGVSESINQKLYALMVEPQATAVSDVEYPADIQISYTERLFGQVLEIETTYYEYGLGAAHGNWMTQTTYYDLTTGETYTLPQLFMKDSNYGKVLGEEIRSMIPTNEWENYLDLEPIDAITDTRTFRLQDKGIEIYFTPYEIAPYAAGQPSFLIPWEAIDGILDKDGDFWKAISR